LERLAANGSLVAQRDDLTIEYVTLLNLGGQYARALDTMLRRTFHPWEGGEGKVAAQYVASLVGLAGEEQAAGHHAAALALLKRAESYPTNLGEGKHPSTSDAQLHYYRGVNLAALGDAREASAAFALAATDHSTLASVRVYHDQSPEVVYYRGLACGRLGRAAEANAMFEQLVARGEQHRNDEIQIDYFAVSLPDFVLFDDEPSRRNRIDCEYAIGLGRLGLGDRTGAQEQFALVLALEPAHLGATMHFSGSLPDTLRSA
jgi:tetratricopeptide (TPR) repeat protein